MYPKRKVQASLLGLAMLAALLPTSRLQAADVIYENDFNNVEGSVQVGEEKALAFDVVGDKENGWLTIFQQDLNCNYEATLHSGATLNFDLYIPKESEFTGVLKAQAVTKMGEAWTWTQSETIPEIGRDQFKDLGNGYLEASVSIPFGNEIESIQGLKAVVPCLAASNCSYKGKIYLDHVKLVDGAPSEAVLVEATKKIETQPEVVVNKDSIVVNDEKMNTPQAVDLVDDGANQGTAQVYAYLKAMGESKGVLYGHQNDTHHKAGNPALSNSDTKDVTGSISAVVGVDALSLTGNELGSWNQTQAERVAACAKMTKEAAGEGAIITLSAHMPNFEVIQNRVKNSKSNSTEQEEVGILSDGTYNLSGYTPNTTTGDIVTRIMPGKDLNEYYTAYLDLIADYAKAVEKDNVTILFRPFHENTGSWFWWGAAFCDEEAFKNVYKYTVEYLRDVKGVHNMLYVYGPSCEAESTKDYEARYPGDDYVDMVGFDMYHQNPTPNDQFIEQFKKEINIVDQFAQAHQKLFAVTETGISNGTGKVLLNNNNLRKDWYNEILEAVSPSSASYFLLWANFGKDTGYYTPYVETKTDDQLIGHEMLDNFIDFYNAPNSIFAKEVGQLSNLEVKVNEKKDVMAYITAPVSGERVLTTTTLKASINDQIKEGSKVIFKLKNKAQTIEKNLEASKNKDGVYEATLTETDLKSLGESTGTIELLIDDELYNQIHAKFNMPEPIMIPTVVDDFESYYGDDTLLNDSWSIGKGSGCTLEPTLGTVVGSGKSSLCFKYHLVDQGYIGVTKSLDGVDWSKENALQLWTKPDAMHQKVVVQITSAGKVFEVYLNDYEAYQDETEPMVITIPFSKFVGRDNKEDVFDPSQIDSFGLWCNTIVPEGKEASTYEVNSTLYYDEIKAVTTNETEVNFEK